MKVVFHPSRSHQQQSHSNSFLSNAFGYLLMVAMLLLGIYTGTSIERTLFSHKDSKPQVIIDNSNSNTDMMMASKKDEFEYLNSDFVKFKKDLYASLEDIYNTRIDTLYHKIFLSTSTSLTEDRVELDDEIESFSNTFDRLSRDPRVVQPDVESALKSHCPHVFSWSKYEYINSKSSLTDLHEYESYLTEKLNKQRCNNPDNVESFICRAQCALHEPELERTARILRIASHSVVDIVKLCIDKVAVVLVWISDSKIRYLNCWRRKNKKGKWTTDIIEAIHPLLEAMRLLKMISCIVKLPNNMVFGFDPQDYAVPTFHAPHESYQFLVQIPGLVRFVGTRAHDSLLFPTGSHLTASAHCHFRKSKYYWKVCDGQGNRHDYPWHKKNSTIIWRGLPTGDCCSIRYRYNNQRIALTKLYGSKSAYARNQTKTGKIDFDVGIVGNPAEEPDEFRREFETVIGFTPKISKQDHVKYKYLLHIDGNTASWGSSHKYNSGSAVLLVKSRHDYLEYYYTHLKPWIHYIPVSADLGDLEYIQKWLTSSEENDKIAQQIAKNSETLFQTRFRAQDIHCYVMRLVHSIAAAQTVGPKATREYLSTLLEPEVMNDFIEVDDSFDI